jgi:uncharacterized protein YegL
MKKIGLTLVTLLFCVALFSQNKDDTNTEKITSSIGAFSTKKGETETEFIKRVNKSLNELSKKGWYAVQFDRKSFNTNKKDEVKLTIYVLLNKKYKSNAESPTVYLHDE